jgi:Flp pilus assembly protein TadD
MLSALLRQIFKSPARAASAGVPEVPRASALDRARALSAERRFDEAAAEVERVLGVETENVDAFVLKGSILRRQKRLAEAKRVLEHALTLDPKCAEGWLDLGTCYRLENDPFWARFYLRLANVVEPSNADVWNELGLVEITLGNFEHAEESIENAVSRNPAHAEAWNNLGMILARRRELGNARRHFLRAVFLKPEFYMAACNLGLVSRDLERFEDAERELRRALELDPCPTAARLNLAVVLQDLGRPDEACAVLEAAHAQLPQDADVAAALSALWLRLGDGPRALRFAEVALACAPENPEARLALGTAQLAAGNFAEGWEHYEARLHGGHGVQRQFPIPRWRGEALHGKRLFVYGEQGLGDEIMFASCLPDLIADGAHCLLDCNPRLRELLRESFPAVDVLDALSRPASPEVIDVQADFCTPIGSLPRMLRTSRARFAGGKPYLKADERRTARWRERLATLGAGLNVGISWRGGLARTGRTQRSVDLETLLPVLRTPGVHWVSLQHDAKQEEVAALERRHGVTVAAWDEVHADFGETAALMCALDMVITVCSTVVHLAGALGRTTLVLTPYGAEWRYMLEGSSMPWYASVSLIRQSRRNDWSTVLAAVGERLGLALRAQVPQASRGAS